LAEPKKILVIQTAFLGDVILTLPMVQTLKNLMPGSLIDFLCIPLTSNVLENNPAINKVIQYDKKGKDKLNNFFGVLTLIRETKYDIVLCPHRSFRSALITYFSKANVRIGYEKNSLSFLLTDRVKYDNNVHEIQRNLDIMAAIPGLTADDSKITQQAKLYPDEKDVKIVQTLFDAFNHNNLVSFAPCSKWYTKQLTIEKSKEILSALKEKGIALVLIGGALDFEYCKQLEQEAGGDNLLNLCGRLTPVQSYVAISKTKALITVDSASQHLGGASDVPILLIYGSTNSKFGFFPLTNKYKIVENNDLDCRPCTDHGRHSCPKGHFKCIKELSAPQIIEYTEMLMQ